MSESLADLIPKWYEGGTTEQMLDEAFAQIRTLESNLGGKQAVIDRLMLEYCPDEMSETQLAEWSKHQRAVPDEVSLEIDAASRPEGVAIKALEALKINHDYCEDPWYSCPLAPEGCADERKGPGCECGADAHNAKVDAIIKLLEPQEQSK